jgi:hypothetical protein
VNTRGRTAGLGCFRCACGKDVKVLDILDRTLTGRETVRHFCCHCGCISWWWRVPGPPEKVMLFDREERPAGEKCWPPTGWTRRHMPKGRR